MIQKILRGKGFGGLLAYVSGPGRSGDEHRAEFLFANRIDGSSPAEYADGLRSVANFRRDVERPVVHVVLRLAPGEQMPNEVWRSMASEYMQRMGFADAPYVVYRHHDIKQGDHIHIVASRVDWNADVVSNSFERVRGRLIVRDFERRYQLTQTRDAAPARTPTQGQYHAAERTLEPSRRVQLQGLIREAAKDNPSLPEFAARLAKDGVQVRPNIASTGYVSGLTFEAGPQMFQGSQLGRDFSWRALQQAGVHYDVERDGAAVRALVAAPAQTSALWTREATTELNQRLATIQPPRGRDDFATARRDLSHDGSDALRGTASALSLLSALRSPAALTRRALSLVPGVAEVNQLVSATQSFRSPASALALGLRVSSSTLHHAARLVARRQPIAAIERRVVEAYVRSALVGAPAAELLEQRLAASGIQIVRGRQPLLCAGDKSFTGQQVGLSRETLRSFEGFTPRPLTPEAFRFNHQPPQTLTPAERTPFALREHVRALGEERVDLIVRPPGNAPATVRENVTPAEIEAALPWLRKQNADGASIFLRPRPDSHLVSVPVASAQQLRDAAEKGYSPVAVVTPGPGRAEAWVRLAPASDPAMSAEVRQLAQQAVRAAYGLPPYQERPAFGHLAGFTTNADASRPYARLRHAEPMPSARGAEALRGAAATEITQREARLASVLNTHRLEAPATYHARFPHDPRIGDAAFVRDALAARMPKHQVVEALLHQGAKAAGTPPEVQLAYAARQIATVLQQQGIQSAQALVTALASTAKAVSVVGTVLQVSRFAIRLAQDLLHERGR